MVFCCYLTCSENEGFLEQDGEYTKIKNYDENFDEKQYRAIVKTKNQSLIKLEKYKSDKVDLIDTCSFIQIEL